MEVQASECLWRKCFPSTQNLWIVDCDYFLMYFQFPFSFAAWGSAVPFSLFFPIFNKQQVALPFFPPACASVMLICFNALLFRIRSHNWRELLSSVIPWSAEHFPFNPFPFYTKVSWFLLLAIALEVLLVSFHWLIMCLISSCGHGRLQLCATASSKCLISLKIQFWWMV